MRNSLHALTCLLLIGATGTVSAQPSGGPYGPVRQNYSLPKSTGTIYYVSVDGKAGMGESLNKPTTIESAIERVKTGDAIVLRGGTYRIGNLMLNQGITIQPYADEKPVLKGTFVADKWENLGNGLWITKWDRLFPETPQGWWRRNREGKSTPLHRFNNDMVFVDGEFLQSAGWEGEVDEHSFYIDYDRGIVYIGTDPEDRLVEITAFNIAIFRTTGESHGKKSDKRGYTLRGVTLTQYAYRALEIQGTDPEGLSDESKHGKEVVGTTIEDCTISYCSRVAGYFRGDHFTMRQCKISDTSTEGVYLLSSSDCLLERNIFTRNNIERITGYYPAAVKIFNQCYRVTCNDNLVIDLPYSNGIWYDVGNVDGVFTNNWVEGVGHVNQTFRADQTWPSDNGFFFEISKGVICAGNVFVNCDHGLMILNASNARIYQNTFVNSTAVIGRNGRSAAGDHFGWHPSTGPDVDERVGHVFANNLLTGDEWYNKSLLFVWQPDSMCRLLPNPPFKQLDHNVYVRVRAPAKYPLILWSPAKGGVCQSGFEAPESLNKMYPEYSGTSRAYFAYDGPLFKGSILGNYELMPEFSGSKSGLHLPMEISRLLSAPAKESRYVGAYPPMP